MCVCVWGGGLGVDCIGDLLVFCGIVSSRTWANSWLIRVAWCSRSLGVVMRVMGVFFSFVSMCAL